MASMYSVLILVLAAVNAGVALWGLREWDRLNRPTILLFNLLALAAVALHVLLAGLGHFVGAGEQLRGLYALPLLVATFALPASLFTFATISRGTGFAWARIDWGHGAVCLFAVALLLYSLPGILAMRLIGPACWNDVVWYLRAVPPALACPGIAPEADLPAKFPVVPAAVLAAYLGLGAGLWWRERWPWLLAGTGPGILLLLLPLEWGPLPRLLGESLCFCAIAVSAVRYVRLKPPPAVAPGEAAGA